MIKRSIVVFFAALFLISSFAMAEENPTASSSLKKGESEEKVIKLDEVVVRATAIDEVFIPLNTSVVNEAELQFLLPATSDTASLLRDIPGISIFSAGGVSSLPVIHGMADDRLRIKVDGMDLIPACPNHMNSPLSYIDPSNVGSIKVFAGITPVSLGGDSIGGTIIVNSAEPEFAKTGEGMLHKEGAGVFYRSNGNAKGGNLTATIAGEKISMTYNGSTTESGNYKAARDFKSAGAASTDKPNHYLAGDEVGSSAYKSENHAIGLALRHENHLADLKLSYQHIPYEWYPNQRMDMTDNKSLQGNLRYKGKFDWGALEARLYNEHTRHKMDFADDKQFQYGVAPGMPMETDGENNGMLAKADFILSEKSTLRLGVEAQQYRLDDWWPPSPNDQPTFIGGMSPDTFWNINKGKRDRYGLFTEWEADINQQWTTSLGARYERVNMDTGTVQGYNSAASGMYYIGYLLSATNFNAADRKRADDNIDLTALARYTHGSTMSFEFGYAHKTRSPNLYERYSWSRNAMALIMNNFVGDGNGYLGNLDLKPERADTLSATVDMHAADGSKGFKATPYYTYVNDYIDAVQWNRTTNLPLTPAETSKFLILKYMNQSARIYGLDLSGHIPLATTGSLGEFSLKGLLNYTNGKNQTTGDDLYNIMPLNLKLTLAQKLGGWNSSAEVQWVDAKNNVSDARIEMKTAAYTLVNLRASYEWKYARFDLGAENVFNEFYSLPQGGAYVGQGATMSLNGVPWGIPVPGMGRSIYTGLSVKF